MKIEKLKKEVSAVEVLEGSTTEVSKTNKAIIAEEKKEIKLETLKDIIYNLQHNFIFGNVYLFLDLDINKNVIINYNSKDKFDTMKAYDKQAITPILKSMLLTRMRLKEVAYFDLDKSTLQKITGAVQGVKKSFDRKAPEIFTDTDYLPTLNMFKRTPLQEFEVINTIEYKTLYEALERKYKRLHLLLKNNIGNYDSIKWFLNWVSMEINKPGELKTTFIIIGDQGSGKSILTEEFFKENIYHHSNVSVLDNKTLKDNFNDIYSYKSFVIMNEVSTMDLKENNQIAQDLKRLITDDSFINRGMHKSGVEKKKTFNLAFTTNKNAPVQIEHGDRRFTVFGRGKKLLEMEEVEFILKQNNETFGDFIDNVKLEIRDFLYLVKSLNFDSNVAIQPFETPLKADIINKTNTKDVLMRSLFKEGNYKQIAELLEDYEFNNETRFYDQFEKMFKYGIFTNEILAELYVALYDIDTNREKNYQQKSGSFWSKVLEKGKMSTPNGDIRFKVFNTENPTFKKSALKAILDGTELPTLEEDMPF